MKRLPLVLTLVALVALAASIAYWILQLYRGPQRPITAAPIAEAPPPSMDAAATLFGGQPSAAVATNFQLTGVISAGEQGVAILVANNAPAKALMIGKEIAPGVTLAEVHARYVMLSDGGVMKRIDLATDTKAAAPMNAPAQPQFAPPPPAPSPEAAAEAEAAHPPSPGVQEEPQPAPAIPTPPPANAVAVPSATNPPVSSGAVPQPQPQVQQPQIQQPQIQPAPAPTQMPAPTRSPGSPVSQPPSAR